MSEKQIEEQPVQPGRADHLKPYLFQPGQSGNPKGRPKKTETPYAEIVREMLAARGVVLELSYLNKAGKMTKKRIKLDVSTRGKTIAHAIAVTQLQKALKGDLAAAEALINRAEGKPLERVKDETDVPSVTIKFPNPVELDDMPEEGDSE